MDPNATRIDARYIFGTEEDMTRPGWSRITYSTGDFNDREVIEGYGIVVTGNSIYVPPQKPEVGDYAVYGDGSPSEEIVVIGEKQPPGDYAVYGDGSSSTEKPYRDPRVFQLQDSRRTNLTSQKATIEDPRFSSEPPVEVQKAMPLKKPQQQKGPQ